LWKKELDYWVSVIRSDSMGVEPILEAAIRKLYRSPPSKPERIGLIHFGSRVDISFESAGINLLSKKGDKVLAGQQLAGYTPLSSLSVAEKIFEVPKRMLSKLQATQNNE